MELTLKPSKRNLQPIYDDIIRSYKNGNVEDMRLISREFITELRTTKLNQINFSKKVNSSKSKDELLFFITNIHMQDSVETSSIK